MKILIANDHRGLELKNKIQNYLVKNNYIVENLGTDTETSVDYPTLAFNLAAKIDDNTLGILICGTGIGMSIAANKVKGIRCAKVTTPEEARLCREHNNANVIAISSNLSQVKAKKIIKNFIETNFSNDDRHKRRIDMIDNYERGNNA